MKKTKMLALVFALLMIPALALAQGPVLLVELPEQAQMTENVAFEDGDFIQSYRIQNAQVQLLRYGQFDMTLEELVESDWAENCGTEALDIAEISGFPAQGVRVYQAVDAGGYPVSAAREALGEEQQLMEIRLVLVDMGEGALIYQDMCPAGETQALPPLDSLKVQEDEGTAEVG